MINYPQTYYKKAICKIVFILIISNVALLAGVSAASAADHKITNIVVVHGAFVDGSGWKPVYDILTKDGFKVTVVQEPLTSLDADVAATKRIIAGLDGPIVLVAHSYGGSVITEAGNDSKVASLVYIAAHAPDVGENEAANGKRMPPASASVKKTPDGFLYIDPVRFHADFAADLPLDQANFEAHSQILTSAKVFSQPITVAAWKYKPSWYLVAKSDRIINPDLERMYARRAHSYTIEVEGASHSVYESHPKAVAQLIEQAAHLSKQPPR